MTESMKKLYDWLTVWEKYTTTDKGRQNNQPESSGNEPGVKKRRLKIPRRKQSNDQTPSSSSSGVDISDVQLFDKDMGI